MSREMERDDNLLDRFSPSDVMSPRPIMGYSSRSLSPQMLHLNKSHVFIRTGRL